MGLFSWNCHGCGHPLLHYRGVTNDINHWMNDAIVINPDGSRIEGVYDGYGRLDGVDCDMDSIDWDNQPAGNPCAWHRACWEIAGEPAEYKPSKSSADQGHFFEEGAHDMADPRLPGWKWLEALRRKP